MLQRLMVPSPATSKPNPAKNHRWNQGNADPCIAVPAPRRPKDNGDCRCHEQADIYQGDELVIAVSLGLRNGRPRTSNAEVGCVGNQ